MTVRRRTEAGPHFVDGDNDEESNNNDNNNDDVDESEKLRSNSSLTAKYFTSTRCSSSGRTGNSTCTGRNDHSSHSSTRTGVSSRQLILLFLCNGQRILSGRYKAIIAFICIIALRSFLFYQTNNIVGIKNRNKMIKYQNQQQLLLLLQQQQQRQVASFKNESNSNSSNNNGNNTNYDPSLSIPVRTPTHHACDGYDGILHIQSGDRRGGVGAIFVQFTIAQILYAEQNNLKPWIYLNGDISRLIYDDIVHGRDDIVVNVTMMTGRYSPIIQPYHNERRWWYAKIPGPLSNTSTSTTTEKQETLQFTGTGAWEHYLEPISDYVPGDISCQNKSYVKLTMEHVTPAMHIYTPYTPKAWRYVWLPDYISKPHIPYNEWMESQRIIGARVMSQYYRFRPYLHQEAERVNPNCTDSNACLGMHIRHSDKGKQRRKLDPSEFLPFAIQFVKNGGKHIYLATDSQKVHEYIQSEWPQEIRTKIRTMGDDIVRSNDKEAVFNLGAHHRVNREIFVEMLALTRCQFMVHGFSMVTETSVWLNLGLHNRSVNLEDDAHLSSDDFGLLVKKVINGESPDNWPQPPRTNRWWQVRPEVNTTSTEHSCDGYDGILHIANVGQYATTGSAFFISILNQLIYSNMHNLKPWIHLKADGSPLVYDNIEHNSNAYPSFQMMSGMGISDANTKRVLPEECKDMIMEQISTSRIQSWSDHIKYWWRNCPTNYHPGPPAKPINGLSTNTFELGGTGVWNSYFEPVSDFIPGDKSCQEKPFIEMEEPFVSHGLNSFAPWSVKAWRYDNVPENLWKPRDMSLKDFYKPMRKKAHEIVDKYFKFHPFLVEKANEVNPIVNISQPCLAVHLRGRTLRGNYRKRQLLSEYLDYIDAFERAGGQNIYFASDDGPLMNFILESFPDEELSSQVRSQGRYVARTTNEEWPIHLMDDHHRLNSEALVDILAMSKCQLLLYGFSTVAEAAIYINPLLHENSVNLEDPHRLSPKQFGALARSLLGTTDETINEESKISQKLRRWHAPSLKERIEEYIHDRFYTK